MLAQQGFQADLGLMQRVVHCASEFERARVRDRMSIRIGADGTPYSELYGDVYFSEAGALEEYAHVFHAGQQLSDRLREARKGFAIGELGFGSGLGFVATASLWSACAKEHSGTLHYVSFEKHPLTSGELERIHALQIARAVRCEGRAYHQAWSERLLKAWKPLTPGFHRLRFDLERVVLDVYLGDALEGLRRTEILPRDAWFLHGFSPAKNPELWSEEVFSKLARFAGTTVSTFSVSQTVRTRLRAQGFEVELKPGFGPKRQMLFGVYRGDLKSGPAFERLGRPWFRASEKISRPNRVAIVGGGIAGASMARALDRRGIGVVVLEREQALALHASGNPAALLMPRLSAERNPRSEIILRSSAYALSEFEKATSVRKNLSGHQVEVPDPEEYERLSRALKSAGVFPGFARLEKSALYYENAGWICAPELVRAWLEVPSIQVHKGVEALSFDCGVLKTTHGPLQVDAVVWSRGAAALGDDLRAIQGQWAFVESRGAPSRSMTLDGGSWIPEALADGRGVLGATYSKTAKETEFIPERSAELVQQWGARGFPAVLTGEGRACFRAVTPDVLPLVGAVPDFSFYSEAYADLRRGRVLSEYPQGRSLLGQWVLTGLGSHGFLMAPFLAECLAAQICGESVPLEVDLLEALHPARFRIRSFFKTPLAKRGPPRQGGPS
jgi:tRNA 5-methylaminomethyl-2-thiouridine biosynthesis bifunctional protein